MNHPRILVAGVGNIFLGDDAFGVEVIKELAGSPRNRNAHVVDFGIRGLDLAYALLDGYDTVILVDAAPRGGEPGQVYLIEPKATPAAAETCAAAPLEAHRMDPARVLQLVHALGGRVGQLLVVGCEPAPLDECDDIHPGLSDTARAAVPVAVELILRLIDDRQAVSQEHSHEVAHDSR